MSFIQGSDLRLKLAPVDEVIPKVLFHASEGTIKFTRAVSEIRTKDTLNNWRQVRGKAKSAQIDCTGYLWYDVPGNGINVIEFFNYFDWNTILRFEWNDGKDGSPSYVGTGIITNLSEIADNDAESEWNLTIESTGTVAKVPYELLTVFWALGPNDIADGGSGDAFGPVEIIDPGSGDVFGEPF